MYTFITGLLIVIHKSTTNIKIPTCHVIYKDFTINLQMTSRQHSSNSTSLLVMLYSLIGKQNWSQTTNMVSTFSDQVL